MDRWVGRWMGRMYVCMDAWMDVGMNGWMLFIKSNRLGKSK